jgi:hypothetical protein
MKTATKHTHTYELSLPYTISKGVVLDVKAYYQQRKAENKANNIKRMALHYRCTKCGDRKIALDNEPKP